MAAKNKTTKGKKRIVWGFVLLGIGILGLFNNISDIQQILMCAVSGGLLLFSGYKAKNQQATYEKYILLITLHRQTQFENLATQFKTNTTEVKNTLSKMISQGHFPGAYIDENMMKIVLPPVQQAQNNVNPAEQLKTGKCPNCGATNMIINGKISECEYCGSQVI